MGDNCCRHGGACIEGRSILQAGGNIVLDRESSMSSDCSASVMVRGNVGASSAVIEVVIAALVCASCQPVEQGFWTKPGMSQPPVSTEYRRDSQECAREGIQQVTVGKPSEDVILTRHPSASDSGSNLYRQCMVSRGYEWVKLQPLVGPSPHGEPAKPAPCPAERVISDPYGYPHCATTDPSRPADPMNGPRETVLPKPVPATSTAPTDTVLPKGNVSRDNVPVPSEHQAPSNGRTPAERRVYDNSVCIQHSQTSLSSPYDTYLRCMAEKGWPVSPR